LGSRDAVLTAAGADAAPRGFPSPEPDYDLLALAREGIDPALADAHERDGVVTVSALGATREAYIEAGRLAERLRILAKALRSDVTVKLG
jgi:coenzyme F420-0:L-glutamate ligase/coenzyme F420-1:gamma-L-glutamate ligase